MSAPFSLFRPSLGMNIACIYDMKFVPLVYVRKRMGIVQTGGFDLMCYDVGIETDRGDM